MSQRVALITGVTGQDVNCTQFPWTPICPRGDRNDDVQHEKDRSSFSR